jgi:hypothetical protein
LYSEPALEFGKIRVIPLLSDYRRATFTDGYFPSAGDGVSESQTLRRTFCGAANPGCSRLSAGFFVSRIVSFYRKRRSRTRAQPRARDCLPLV